MNREELLALDDLATDTFDCPKWGEVTIREMNGEQREELETLIRAAQSAKPIPGANKKSVRATAAVFSMINKDTGEYIFKVDDVPALAKKSGVALDKVLEHVLPLNAMSKEEAKAIAGN
jgi:hypothetical protein